ncbi:hypothetical protein HDU98_006354 [Podochytrium sp. JEL0797]|nr:hypothetical protein HDU98_006354 [Podochytrium sp. JEL0797]
MFRARRSTAQRVNNIHTHTPTRHFLCFLICLTHPAVAQKNQSFVELGILDSYSYASLGVPLNSSTVPEFLNNNTQVDLNGSDGFTYINDIAIQAAVNMINNNPLILPNTTVIIRRFNDLDPALNISPYSSQLTNGFATQMMINNVEQRAGGFQDIGINYVRLLQFWNVTRVALVTQFDDPTSAIIFYTVADNIQSALEKHGIRVLAECIGPVTLAQTDITSIGNCLKLVDARFIVVNGIPEWIAQAYYYLGTLHGLVDSEHVWISPRQPAVYGDPTQIFGPTYWQLMKGYVNFSPGTGVVTSGYDIETEFDCAMTLMYGLDQVLRGVAGVAEGGPNISELKNSMNYSAFMNTGYDGLVEAPMILTSSGDLALQFVACTNIMQNCTNFGETNSNGTSFSNYPSILPMFYSNSSIPPPDGPPIVQLIISTDTLSTAHGKFILSLSILGIACCIGCFIFIIRNQAHALVKAKIIFQSYIFAWGLLFMFLSMIFYLNAASFVTCQLRIWLFGVGSVLCLASLVAKNVFTTIVFASKTVLMRAAMNRLKLVQQLFPLLCASAQIILLSIFTWKDGQIPVYITVGSHSINTCTSTPTSSPYELAIYGFSGFLVTLLLPTVYYARNVKGIHNETGLLVLIPVISLLYALVCMIVNSQLGPTTGMYTVVCLWVSCMIVMVLVFGPTVFAIEREVVQGMLALKIIGQGNTPLPVAATTKMSSNVLGVSAKSARVVSSAVGALKKLPATPKWYHERVRIAEQVVYRMRTANKWSFWSEWKRTLISVYHTKATAWLEFESPDDYACFGFKDLVLGLKGSKVEMKLPTVQFQVEFENSELASKFVQGMEVAKKIHVD